MHYEDVALIKIQLGENGWFGVFRASDGSNFNYIFASKDMSKEELDEILIERNIIVGRNFLAGIENDSIVNIEGLSYINSRHI